MAIYTSIIKPNAFITLQELAEHLGIQEDKYSVPTEPTPFPKGNKELRTLLERYCNVASDKIESILQTSVLAKSFEEVLDGNGSNAIVPSKWPVTEITEIKIGDLIVDLNNAVLRGFADKRQAPSDVSLRIIGSNIALRDGEQESSLGTITTGSSIGSVKIKYKAGWAKDALDIPSDLHYACLLLAEYYYYQRSNRDLNLTSKGVRGESYSKIKDGIPDTIHELIEQYIDISLPLHQRSQSNT